MNWEAIGAVGEILGALAVLITLIYLALQVRQNTRATNRTAFQELMNYYAQITSFASSREGAELLAKSRHGLESLDEPDRVRILNVTGQVFAHLQNAHQQWAEGFITDSQWRQISAVGNALMTSEGTKVIWDITKDRYSTEFQNWLDGIKVDEQYVANMEERFYPKA